MIVDIPIITGFVTTVPVQAINFDLILESAAVSWARIKVFYRQSISTPWILAVAWDAGTPASQVYDSGTDSYLSVPASAIGITSRNITITDLTSDSYQVGIISENTAGGELTVDSLYIMNLSLDTSSLAGTFKISADPKSPLHLVSKQIEVRGMPEDNYDFRVWRTTVDETAVSWQDDIYLRGYAEIINRTLAYPNHTLMGIRAMATDRLYGGRPKVTSIATGEPLSVPSAGLRYDTTTAGDEGVVTTNTIINGVVVIGMRRVLIDAVFPAPDGKYFWLVRMDTSGFAQEDRLLTKFFIRVHTWEVVGSQTRIYIQSSETIPSSTSVMLFHEDVAPTRNTAWAVAKMLITGSHGRITENSIHWESFSAWNSWNMELKNGVPRHLFDAIIDFNTDLWSLAFRTASTARGILAAGGGKFKVVIDRAATPVQLFCEGNGSNFSIDPIPRANRANILTTSFLDETGNYEQKDISIEDVIGDEFPIVKSIPVQVGVVRECQVVDLLQYMLLQNRYVGNMISLEAGIDSIETELGDVFWAQSQAKDFALSGRVVSVIGSTTTIDRVFTPEPGVDYRFAVWGKDNQIHTWQGQLNGADIDQLSTPAGLIADEMYEYPYIISKVTEERMKFRCLGIKRNADTLQASITGIEYRDEIYLND